MVPKPAGQSQAAPRGGDRKAQDGRGGRGPAAPSALREPASAALLPASVRAVRAPASAAVAAVAPAHHGPPDRAGPAAAAAAGPAAAVDAPPPTVRRTRRAAAWCRAAALVAVALGPVGHVRVAHPVAGRRPWFHHQRVVRRFLGTPILFYIYYVIMI